MDRGVVAIVRTKHRDVEHQPLVGSKTGIGRAQVVEAANEPAGARDERDGQRDLGDASSRPASARCRARPMTIDRSRSSAS